jgi:protein subunit release factor A
MPREKVMTVTIHECDVQTFKASGKGGQNRDKRDTAVRIVHKPSGARGESREERDQLSNKRKAFVRMADSKLFQDWIKRQHSQRVANIDAWLDDQMRPENLQIECGSSASRTNITTNGA